MPETATIVKVEREEGIRRDRLVVTARTGWGTTVTFKVPDYVAHSYVIGRTVDVTVKLRKRR